MVVVDRLEGEERLLEEEGNKQVEEELEVLAAVVGADSPSKTVEEEEGVVLVAAAVGVDSPNKLVEGEGGLGNPLVAAAVVAVG